MGQRANLLIVEGGKYQIFYSHWCANTLTRNLFWGPDYALQFIRIQREVDESDWLDEVWAEGAAIVDLDKQTLLLFGGEDISYDVPLRRVYLELLSRVWQAWNVQWAYEGIASIADYVGFPRAKVLTTQTEGVINSFDPPEEKGWTDIVASIRWTANHVRLYPLAAEIMAYLFSGPSLLKAAEGERGLDRLALDEWAETFGATGGFHIDVPYQTIEFWTAKDAPDVLARMSKRWPKWRVRWHQDAYEFQSDRTKGLLRFHSPSRLSLEKQVAEMLLREVRGSGADTILNSAELLRAEGKDVKINPWALRDDRLEIPMDVRRRIVASAVGGEIAG